MDKAQEGRGGNGDKGLDVEEKKTSNVKGGGERRGGKKRVFFPAKEHWKSNHKGGWSGGWGKSSERVAKGATKETVKSKKKKT